jgi:transglutaminase-like putative cysteine protease
LITLVTDQPVAAFLEPAPLVDSDAPEIGMFVDAELAGLAPAEAARRAFTFVRDQVQHSWDIQGRRVTRSATDALAYREGICYPKSHLLAAVLRRFGIPTAMCYQRLTLLDDDSAGYAVHALNAVYLNGRWSRLDARGNKPGVNAQFDLEHEQLAFPVRAAYDEIDHPQLYAAPHPSIVETLTSNDNVRIMYRNRLPAALT